jgi:hypothetical protein
MVVILYVVQFKSTALIKNMVNQEVLDGVKTVNVFYYAEANILVKQVPVLQRQLFNTGNRLTKKLLYFQYHITFKIVQSC